MTDNLFYTIGYYSLIILGMILYSLFYRKFGRTVYFSTILVLRMPKDLNTKREIDIVMLALVSLSNRSSSVDTVLIYLTFLLGVSDHVFWGNK